MKIYRPISLFLMLSFITVGLAFLFFPARILVFFNGLSGSFGLPLVPLQDAGFYNILAVGYMYLVSLLAFSMFRHPENRFFPLLLANAKFATSLLSLGFAAVLEPYLIFWVNAAVDGLIGVVVLLLSIGLKKRKIS